MTQAERDLTMMEEVVFNIFGWRMVKGRSPGELRSEWQNNQKTYFRLDARPWYLEEAPYAFESINDPRWIDEVRVWFQKHGFSVSLTWPSLHDLKPHQIEATLIWRNPLAPSDITPFNFRYRTTHEGRALTGAALYARQFLIANGHGGVFKHEEETEHG